DLVGLQDLIGQIHQSLHTLEGVDLLIVGILQRLSGVLIQGLQVSAEQSLVGSSDVIQFLTLIFHCSNPVQITSSIRIVREVEAAADLQSLGQSSSDGILQSGLALDLLVHGVLVIQVVGGSSLQSLRSLSHSVGGPGGGGEHVLLISGDQIGGLLASGGSILQDSDGLANQTGQTAQLSNLSHGQLILVSQQLLQGLLSALQLIQII